MPIHLFRNQTPAKSKIRSTLILAVILALFSKLVGQGNHPLSKVYPVNITEFGIEEGLPGFCSLNLYTDPKGRVYITTCTETSGTQFIYIYQFDGYRAKIIPLKEKLGAGNFSVRFRGITKEGLLFGYLFERNHLRDSIFLLNPGDYTCRTIALPQNGSSVTSLLDVTYAPETGHSVYAQDSSFHYIYHLEDKQLRLLHQFPRILEGASKSTSGIMFQQRETYWLWEGENAPLIRYQPATGVINRFWPKDFNLPGGTSLSVTAITEGPDGEIMVSMNQGASGFYSFDPKTQAFHTVSPFSLNPTRSKYVEAIPDDVGNLMLFGLGMDGNYAAILHTADGQQFDYSPVLSAITGSLDKNRLGITRMKSRDFRENTWVLSNNGLFFVELGAKNAIQSFATKASRAIAEVAPDVFLIKSETLPSVLWEANSRTNTLLPFPGADRAGPQKNLSDFICDDIGNLYFAAPGGILVQHNLQKNTSKRFSPGVNFSHFTFAAKDRIVLATEGETNGILFFDLQKQQFFPLLFQDSPVQIPGRINQLLVGKDGLLYVAASQGLWQIDMNTGKSLEISKALGIRDNRITCLLDGGEGRLWAGTYLSGIQVYNLATKTLEQVIDRDKGLSNNTVVSILRDNEGVFWAGTFKGVTLISEDGVVLNKIFQEDGLVNNECNRYSALKARDGRLLIGTINGVNIINSQLVKKQLVGKKEPDIYLTELSWFDAQKQRDTTLSYDFDNLKTIFLPATKRYLKVKFALSDFSRVKEIQFAYAFQFRSNPENLDWNFIGATSILNLSNLPAGDYNILIKGSNYRGIWTSSPLVVHVKVARYFYQQTWFYLLCFFLLALLTAIWFYRQYILREKLKKELAVRSAEFLEARDQLIVQEKLASLGQMVAGIAHEIKNPLNFVNNFSEGSMELLDELETELREQPGISSEPPRYAPIFDLINELKQNASDILSNGNRADRIIRSMMDHAKGVRGERRPENLNELVADNINLAYHGYRAVNPAFNVTIDKQLDEALGLVPVYPQDLGRAILNVVNNACQALNKKAMESVDAFVPTLTVRTMKRDGFAEIHIRDNGPGIRPEILDKIFQPFFTTKTAGEGNIGLGLSISYDIVVQQHKGKFEVETEMDTFTEFIICLPLV